MEYVLKVSPKGQVTLPKKLRESVQVTNLVVVRVDGDRAELCKPADSVRMLSGCFRQYAIGKADSVETAINKTREIVARETASKAH